MPVPLLSYMFDVGVAAIPYLFTIGKIFTAGFLLWLLKTYFGGARNTAARNMHSKVVIITVSMPTVNMPPLLTVTGWNIWHWSCYCT